MILITDKFSHEILSITTNVSYDDAGNPIDNSTGIGFFIEQTCVNDNVEIPDTIQVRKYCYTTADGFYANPNYKQDTIEDRITNIESNIDYLMLLTDADSATEEDE